MGDLLVRDVPDDVIAGIDAKAERLRLSRSEYLRRQLAREAYRSGEKLSRADLSWFADAFADLDDPEVMARAWQ